MARTTWPEFWKMLAFMDRGKEGEAKALEKAQDIASYGSTLLDIQRKKRELAGPSPREKWTEEQRSKQVGSALEMFGNLYRTASPASKRRLTEQMTSLWGLMNPADQTKFKMMMSHTPINPRVQKAMWFEETNPRPRMPVVREGDGTWTNVPPRSEEFRRVWAEYDVASDEWETLRAMAIEGKTPKEMGYKDFPKQYQTDSPDVTVYRDPVDRRIKSFYWKDVDQAEVANAIEKGWATQADIMKNGVVPISPPRDYSVNSTPVTVRQVKPLVGGGTRLQYDPAGPTDESGIAPPRELTDAVHLVDSGISPVTLKEKNPAVVGLYTQLAAIIGEKGQDRINLQLDLQKSIAEKYPSEKRFIPFVPEDVSVGFWGKVQGVLDWLPIVGWVVPTPVVGGGKGGNVILVQADRLVTFLDSKGEQRMFWWSDINRIAYDTNGMPIKETLGKVPGEKLNLEWSK